MPEKITVLTRETADRIAAGEVVERPSSIVKELLENALDAGATEIVVELERGGVQAIRVSDNGSGIDPDDAEIAFQRHATSKISGFDDLYKISSFGFRGEALPSIAAVSTVEMVTKVRGAFSGKKVRVEKGKVTENIEVGCPEGTMISVRDIFGNVPVRKKFLKKESAELSHCLETVAKTILARPRVGVRVAADGKSVLSIPAAAQMSTRITLALGIDVQDRLLPVGRRHGQVRIEGFTSRPDVTSSTSKGILCYVNGRYVRDALVTHAVMTAYRRMIEPRRYPQTVLFVDLPPGDVDVNVHPAKMEVRFRNPREIYEAVLSSLVGALAGPAHATEKHESHQTGGPRDVSIEPYRGRMEEALRRFAGAQVVREAPGLWAQSADYVSREERPAGFFRSLDYIGQAGNTYLIFTRPGGIVILDQHAAHERILFEKLRKEADRGAVTGQRLLVPEVMSLSPANLAILEKSADFFSQIGIEVEPFGGSAVKVTSFPLMLSRLEPAAVITDILDVMAEIGKKPAMAELRDKVLVVMACKGAVKAHEGLAFREVEGLCRDLDDIPFASTCPHGRPLYVKLDIKDLERMFKRT